MSTTRVPSRIRLDRDGRHLQLEYSDGSHRLDAEYLRVESPSAEVQGHGGVGGTLPTGKSDVRITAVDRCGRYAVQLTFDDGHDSGIYTWDYLWQLVRERDQRWSRYLAQLRQLGKSRDGDVQVVRLIDPGSGDG